MQRTFLTAFPALLLVLAAGCSTRRVTTKTETTQGHPTAENPDGKEVAHSMSFPLNDAARDEADAAADKKDEVMGPRSSRLIYTDEGMALRDGGYRVVKVVERTEPPTLQLATEENGERWKGRPIGARPPKLGEVRGGDLVFYCHGGRQGIPHARKLPWKLGRVERVDGMFGNVVIGGTTFQASREILIPTEPVSD
jgi:hypothetical protein